MNAEQKWSFLLKNSQCLFIMISDFVLGTLRLKKSAEIFRFGLKQDIFL